MERVLRSQRRKFVFDIFLWMIAGFALLLLMAISGEQKDSLRYLERREVERHEEITAAVAEWRRWIKDDGGTLSQKADRRERLLRLMAARMGLTPGEIERAMDGQD